MTNLNSNMTNLCTGHTVNEIFCKSIPKLIKLRLEAISLSDVDLSNFDSSSIPLNLTLYRLRDDIILNNNFLSVEINQIKVSTRDLRIKISLFRSEITEKAEKLIKKIFYHGTTDSQARPTSFISDCEKIGLSRL